MGTRRACQPTFAAHPTTAPPIGRAAEAGLPRPAPFATPSMVKRRPARARATRIFVPEPFPSRHVRYAIPCGSSATVRPLTSEPLRARAVIALEKVPLEALPRRTSRIDPPGPSQATSAPFAVPVAAISPFVAALPRTR